jgi:Nucleotide modification associated domain 1
LELLPVMSKIQNTKEQYLSVIAACTVLFEKKTIDYGTAWRILRLPSLTDQIFIKAQRIRSIQEKGTQKVDENIEDEFVAIINYCIIALIQMKTPKDAPLELPVSQVIASYKEEVSLTIDLLLAKNHDYGEAWRDMRINSITDIILMKVYRTKQIEDNSGKTLVSEGVDANYRDMINYSVFCLIKMGYNQ